MQAHTFPRLLSSTRRAPLRAGLPDRPPGPPPRGGSARPSPARERLQGILGDCVARAPWLPQGCRGGSAFSELLGWLGPRTFRPAQHTPSQSPRRAVACLASQSFQRSLHKAGGMTQAPIKPASGQEAPRGSPSSSAVSPPPSSMF